MSILALYAICHAKRLGLALHLIPHEQGFTIRIQIVRKDWARPRFEKRFNAGTPIADAIDRAADGPLAWVAHGSGSRDPR